MTLRLIFHSWKEVEVIRKHKYLLIKPGRLLEGHMYTGEISNKNNTLGKTSFQHQHSDYEAIKLGKKQWEHLLVT